jgi:hypothetical protein
MNWKAIAFVLIISFGAYQHWQKRAVEYGPGVMAAEAPIQVSYKNRQDIRINQYQIIPLEQFSLRARVLSTKSYFTDREAALSPIDFALGWGRMSDESVLQQIQISQSNRWYHWRTDNFPIPRREIETHSANMHMVPANDEIAQRLKSVRKGQVVSIEGFLIEAKHPDGWRWRSSLTREDVGSGACEVVLVNALHVD